MMKRMGTFHVGCKVVNHTDPKKVAVVKNLLVDTGSDFTWLPAEVLERLGIVPAKKDQQIQMANGQIVTRDVGYAILRVDKYETTDEVVFAQRGDLLLLGARALEGLRVHVDPRRKQLVASGPALAASTGITF
jgi:predicted aspartyl protease